jgi:DNA replication protein DnaC
MKTKTTAVDPARIGLLLGELRLPASKLMWPDLAEQADTEGWPAARFLAALVEHELAERDRRRIARHLAEARLLPGETSVLFELISARYERRSMLITANQPFGEWGKIFPDPAMTLAAVDRLVHHATIFELNVESYRRREAVKRKGPGRPAAYATLADTAPDDAPRQST